MKKTETRLVEVPCELYDSTGAEKILFNRIFPIQVRYDVLIQVFQRNKSIGKERNRNLVQGIGSYGYGSKKSHSVLSASWRPRKAGGVAPIQLQSPENQGNEWRETQPESEGLRTRSTDGWPRAGEDGCSSPAELEPDLPLPFCSAQTLSGLDDVHWHQ